MKHRNPLITTIVTLGAIACTPITLKTEKKARAIDASSSKSASDLNLASASDFLNQLDGLKNVAADALVKEMAKRDYRAELRKSIRMYRKYLIENGTHPDIKISPFYISGDLCQYKNLDFNLDETNKMLGAILKTAVLAKLSEVNAPQLNKSLSNELAAIGQIILIELGVKVDGNVDVIAVDDVTQTIGKVTISLLPIADEEIDEATKKSDTIEILSLVFNRTLGKHQVGTFDAALEVPHEKSPGVIEKVQGKLTIDRKNTDDRFVHTLLLNVGSQSDASAYSRKMVFEQDPVKRKTLKVTDIFNANRPNEKSYVSILDTEALKQCKIEPPKPTPEPGPGPKDPPSGGGGTTTPPPSNGGGGTTPPPSDGGKPTPPPPVCDDDDNMPPKGDDGGVNQSPNQSPTQTPVQK